MADAVYTGSYCVTKVKDASSVFLHGLFYSASVLPVTPNLFLQAYHALESDFQFPTLDPLAHPKLTSREVPCLYFKGIIPFVRSQ